MSKEYIITKYIKTAVVVQQRKRMLVAPKSVPFMSYIPYMHASGILDVPNAIHATTSMVGYRVQSVIANVTTYSTSIVNDPALL